MSTQPIRKWTQEEYLAFERNSQEKHEFYRGEIFAMAGATRAHGRITSNVGAQLNYQFRNRLCEEFIADMRVKVLPSGLFTYPDIVATCASPQFEDDHVDTLVNPQVIFEVLSKSTELYDRGKKFELYRKIETLIDYILISQDRIAVEHFTRGEDETWVLRSYHELTDVLELETIDCRLPVEEIYLKVELDVSQAADEPEDRRS